MGILNNAIQGCERKANEMTEEEAAAARREAARLLGSVKSEAKRLARQQPRRPQTEETKLKRGAAIKAAWARRKAAASGSPVEQTPDRETSSR